MATSLRLYGICVAAVLLVNGVPAVFFILSGLVDPSLAGRWQSGLVEVYAPFLLWALLFEAVRRRMPWKFIYKSLVFWGASFPLITVVRFLLTYREAFWEFVAYSFPHIGVSLVFFLVQAGFGAGYGVAFYLSYGIIQTLIARRAVRKRARQPPLVGAESGVKLDRAVKLTDRDASARADRTS
jgi:hypothetical protein